MRHVLAALVLALLAAQSRPATLQGHVVRAGSGSPVAHARIVIARVGGSVSDYRTAATDAAGRFSFDSVAPGTYRIYATHDGYAQAEFGRRGAGASGLPVVLGDAQTSPDFEIAMTPAAVITGHVLRRGAPLSSAWVRALKIGYLDGERTFTTADWTQTDDRGEYRLFGLAPGAYFVTVVPRGKPTLDGDSIITPAMATNANGNQRSERARLTLETLTAAAFERGVYPTVYYPGTIDSAAAQPIDVRAGVTVAGIDFALTPYDAFHVRGQVTVVNADPPSPTVRVALQPADTSYALPVAAVRTDASGSFDIGGVPPGRYYLSLQAETREPHADLVAVEVRDQDPPPISAVLRSGSTIRGRVTIDGGPPAAGDPAMLVMLSSIQARGTCCGAARVGADGTFAVVNVVPREYRLRVVQSGRPFWIKSVRFGGEDTTGGMVRVGADLQGRELDIEISTRTASIDALVVDADQHPVSGVLVVAVPPADRRSQSSAYRTATSGGDGHARLDGLAPGDYTVLASDAIDAADWQDPAVLQRYEARGTAARIREAESRTITVRILQ